MLVDEDGVFLETDPATKSEEDATSELAELTEALTEANQRTTTLSEELEDTARLLEEERKRTAELTSKIAEYERAEGHGDPGEIEKLKSDLKAVRPSRCGRSVAVKATSRRSR